MPAILKRIIFSNSRRWNYVIVPLLSANILFPGLNYEDVSYPIAVLLFTLFAYWLHLLRMNLFATTLLLWALYINIDRYLHVHERCC